MNNNQMLYAFDPGMCMLAVGHNFLQKKRKFRNKNGLMNSFSILIVLIDID